MQTSSLPRAAPLGMSGARVLRAARPASRAQAPRVVSVRAATDVAEKTKLFTAFDDAFKGVDSAPPSMKMEASAPVLDAMNALKEAGELPKWGAPASEIQRRNVFGGELTQVGIKNPDDLAKPSIRNDQAFLVTVVGVSSVLAVAAQAFLPGDWGYFGSYLIGGVSIVVLAIGSTAPGLLQFAIDKFSLVYPDYKERVVAHEAAHFLIGYLMGVPVTGYSIMIGKEHTDFAEAKIQRRLVSTPLDDEDLNILAVTSMAGVAAEGMMYPEVIGQNGDLMDLQRLLFRSSSKLSDREQQSITRWSVWQAATLLKKYDAEYKALQVAIEQGLSVPECIKIIENTKANTDDAIVAKVTAQAVEEAKPKAPEPVKEAPKPVAPKEEKKEENDSPFDSSLFD